MTSRVEPCDEDHITFDRFAMLNATPGQNAQANLVNGLSKPRLLMPPGQIERWRILDASFLDEVQIAVFKGKDADCRNLDHSTGPIPLIQIARDGIPLPRPANGADWPFAPPYIFMSSGYRVEVLLDGGKLVHGDTLCVMSVRALQEDETGITPEPVDTTTTPTADDLLRAVSNGSLLAIVNVTKAAGTPSETTMPALAVVAAESPSMVLQEGTVDALRKCQEVENLKDVDREAYGTKHERVFPLLFPSLSPLSYRRTEP